MWGEIWGSLCEESYYLLELVVFILVFAALAGLGFGVGFGIYFVAYALTGNYTASVETAASIAGFGLLCSTLVAFNVLETLFEPRYGSW